MSALALSVLLSKVKSDALLYLPIIIPDDNGGNAPVVLWRVLES